MADSSPRSIAAATAIASAPSSAPSAGSHSAARLSVSRAASVVLVVVAALALGAQPALIAAVALAVVAPRLVRVDLAEHRLPNRLVVPALLAGIIGVGAGWLVTGNPPLVPVLAGAIGGGALFVLAVFGGIGMGDAKLAAALGFASPSVGIALLSPLLAFTLGGVAAVIVMIRRGRHAHLAFGPFLLAGYFGVLAIVAVTRIGR